MKGRENMLRRLGGVLAVIGFIVLLGTVGGSDADLFGWDRLFLQLDISILLIVAGGISIYIDDVRQRSGRRRKKRAFTSNTTKRNGTQAVPYDTEERRAE